MALGLELREETPCQALEFYMTDKYRSTTITEGDSRSPNRSMLRAIGYKDEDFRKPFIGLANGHSTLNPCNAGLQPLADAADRAIRAEPADELGGQPARDAIGQQEVELLLPRQCVDRVGHGSGHRTVFHVGCRRGRRGTRPGGLKANPARPPKPVRSVYLLQRKPGKMRAQLS